MSVDAQSTHATLPTKLSGPKSFKQLSSSVKVPLPETGRSIIIGITSFGMASIEVIGEKSETSISSAPDALKSATAVTRPTKVGVIDKTVLSPLFAPSQNREKTFCFLKIPTKILTKIIIGTE